MYMFQKTVQPENTAKVAFVQVNTCLHQYMAQSRTITATSTKSNTGYGSADSVGTCGCCICGSCGVHYVNNSSYCIIKIRSCRAITASNATYSNANNPVTNATTKITTTLTITTTTLSPTTTCTTITSYNSFRYNFKDIYIYISLFQKRHEYK